MPFGLPPGFHFRIARNNGPEQRAFMVFRFKTDTSSHRFGNCLTDRKAEPCALSKLIEFLEPMENFILFLLRYADTCVFYIQTDSCIHYFIPHFYRSFRSIFNGICDIISHHLCHTVSVKFHQTHIIRINRHQPDFRINHPLLHRRCHAIKIFGQIKIFIF